MRRGNGEGSVYQEKDGRWCAVISLPTGGRKKYHARTRQEAAEKLLAARRTLSDGLPLPDRRQTVGDLLSTWLEDTARVTVRPATYQSYATIVRVHLAPALGRIRLADLTPQHVQRFLNQKSSDGLSPRRVDYLRAVLRRALNQAMRWGLVARNVATLVDPPKATRNKVNPFTPEEARLFLEAIKGDRLEALYTLALVVGLRQGEALGLMWEDIDFVGGTVAIRHALQRIDGELRLVEPKTDRSHRIVPMSPALAARLMDHRGRQHAERRNAGSLWDESHLVFTTALGRPLDGSSVTHRFQKLLAAAGLRHQRFHDLRHACASLLLAQGVSARVVMEILGHSTVTLTLNTYSHILLPTQREALSGMDHLLTQEVRTRRPSRGDAPEVVPWGR